ncbi:acetate kinase [Bacillus sp. AFS073361]|uniref:acetate kinase n=1 Tax=Bacillus sp. AFS073361 TaxID=2033511 RepID=UPI000BF7A29F|nr:acetate kinase [Bacillus sp. AFS073361]PFP25851.1 acetate kinase [Bacillus sp. AFS073361]
MSKILVVNAGSSSLKYQLLHMPEEFIITKGMVDRIGLKDSMFTIEVHNKKMKLVQTINDHLEAVKILLHKLINLEIISSLDEIDGIGHRVVHGGEKFSESVLINDDILREIEDVSELAPLHNPANLIVINAFREILPDVPSVAVFDTAFHQTMPEQSFLYSLPYEYYQQYGIRKYGFHGTSHQYVSQRSAELLKRPIRELRLISCHLGNGASLTAIDGGKSIDTSMGFTPLAGVTMGTRSGNIDPALITYIMEKTGQSAEKVVSILNKESGLLGISGYSSDLRDIQVAAEKGHKRAELALQVFAKRIQEYIGMYAVRMKGLDAIIFTAGIGENSDLIRARVLEGLEFMGVYWDPSLNKVSGRETFISYQHSPVKVMVIPTNEEIMIARDTSRLGIRESLLVV